MITGEWAGTMNLTEPQCGTDLGLIRTKAVPQADGTYKITGQKIWISGGEQDLTENIIHLVLARIEGAPGRHQGHLAVHRAEVHRQRRWHRSARATRCQCGGLEEKMGIHGNATCVMNYDGATGWLVGEEHKGMRTMFVMMNEARLGVGMQGLAQAEVAYQNAADFATDRLQGRSITGAKSAGQARRSDHRASRRAPHADGHEGLHRGRARLRLLDRAAGRSRSTSRRTSRCARRPTTTWRC